MKRLLIVMVVLIVTLMSVSMVAAQQPPPGPGGGGQQPPGGGPGGGGQQGQQTGGTPEAQPGGQNQGGQGESAYVVDENFEGNAGYIWLQDALDEADYYCLDIPGYRDTLNIEAPVNAHTCKPTLTDDQVFAFDYPEDGQIYEVAYDICVEAENVEASSSLYFKECDEENLLQRFEYNDNDQFQLADTELCITVSEESSADARVTGYLRREMSLQSCDDTDLALSQWSYPEDMDTESTPES